ncbi:MAG: glycosyl-4,4'-diaponeurosporenoate acyltransferase CrtO family protein [Microthrixaceae bacterium]
MADPSPSALGGADVVVHLSDPVAILVSCIAWVLIGLVPGYGLLRLPVATFDHDTWLTRLRPVEDDGAWYQRHLRIRAWKDRLPEKGDLFPGGFSKRHLRDRSDTHLRRFAAETRRAETVHWTNLAAGPLFLVWCRPLLGTCMIAFGVLAHLPFILVQRFNRGRLLRLVRRRSDRAIRR